MRQIRHDNSLLAFVVRLAGVLQPASVSDGDRLAPGGLGPAASDFRCSCHTHCTKYAGSVRKHWECTVPWDGEGWCDPV